MNFWLLTRVLPKLADEGGHLSGPHSSYVRLALFLAGSRTHLAEPKRTMWIIKSKFGEHIRSKTDVSIRRECYAGVV